MKKILLITFILIFILGISFFFMRKKDVAVTPVGGTISLPSRLPGAVDSTHISSDFKTQIKNVDQIVVETPVVSSGYALQTWSDENKGGQALLKYTPSKGWVIVTMGGGVWNVAGLVSYGVPYTDAQKLIKDSMNK